MSAPAKGQQDVKDALKRNADRLRDLGKDVDRIQQPKKPAKK